MRKIVIACGGTGGHLTPGIALAQSLDEQGEDSWLFISRKMVDSRLSEKYSSLNFVPMPGSALIRTPLGILRFLREFWSSFMKSLSFFKKKKIDAVVVFGGFTSLGPALAARWLGLPVFTHEANRAVGKAVRFIARYSTRLYLPEGMHVNGISSEIISSIGYPLRHDFRRVTRERARKRLGFSITDKLLVVFGGSQGASALNQWLKNNLSTIASEGISTYCITGMDKESPGVVSLGTEEGHSVKCKFVSFSDEINYVLSAADLVISRAGAGSIAEIICCRVPSILIPYPFAAENHQQLNASFLENKGGCVVCEQEKVAEELIKEVREMMFNEELRGIIRRNLFALDAGDVGGRIARDIKECLNKSSDRETKRLRLLKVFA